jgi:hypothetical protein
VKDENQLRFAIPFVALLLVSMNSLPAANLNYFGSLADAVVVGSVAGAMVSGDEVHFTIRVSRVLKGDFSEATVNILHPWELPSRATLNGPRDAGLTFNPPLWGIWFLTRGVGGAWVTPHAPSGRPHVLGLFVPVRSERPNGPFSYGVGVSLNDALVYEAAAGFQSDADQDPSLILGLFDQMDTEAVRNVLRAYAISGNLRLRIVALAGSLERSLPGAVPALKELWPSISNEQDRWAVVHALRDRWRETSPVGIEQLVRYLQEVPTQNEIRAAGVRALAAVHTRETLPTLASLLVSSEQTEQVQAVYGLSSFANNCPVQTQANVTSGAYLQCDSPGPYKTAGTSANVAFPAISAERLGPLVAFWRGWWSAHPELHSAGVQ